MVIPIFRAVPSMIFIAASMFRVLRSGILVSAISFNCFLLILPTLIFCGCPEPFGTPAAFFNSIDAGGVFRTKV